MSALDRILQSYRKAAETNREAGTYFELLTKAYFQHDPVQKDQYSAVWTYAEWAKEQGLDGKDTGIDLVAKLADEEGFAAIQCKFYQPKYRVQKGDIDSFLSASATKHFVRRVVVDTTEVDWSDNAEATIASQVVPVVRIGLDGLRESAIDWSIFEVSNEVRLQAKKQLREHQRDALAAVQKGFAEHERGKLIMACGTGKTFTALKIAEHVGGAGKRVLFLVPSLALIAQTVREWTKDAEIELRSFAVCSDTQVGKRRVSANDVAEIAAHELDFPATTDGAKLAAKASSEDTARMTVVFSTYQSIPVITNAQAAGLQAFDLIICDEAHRTTGAKIDGEDESNFIRVHDNKHVNGAKRLYMTATPRIYGENARAKAAEASVALCDMDDEKLYGPTFFTRGFSWAVEHGMLTDYKVVVLAMDETLVSRGVQTRLAQDNELQLDDATKIVGCYKALLKQGADGDFGVDAQPMRRAIAFCKDIRSSKLIAREFGAVVDEFNGVSVIDDEAAQHVRCDVRHVDGTFNAKTRGELLHWLGDEVAENELRILSNARCLSEGVDVAALDAILFLHPRKSQIDVVQSVGRVMRRAEGKKLGYVILPVIIPANVTPEQALDDNENYRVVWQILNALRAHDDRFDATINKLELTNDTGGQIEVIAVADNLPARAAQAEVAGLGKGDADEIDFEIDFGDGAAKGRTEEQLSFILDEFPAAIRAKIVQKCGRRTYWEDWATDIGKIAQRHIERIRAILDTGADERTVFDEFLAELRDDLNGAVTKDEAIEMLAQHLITKPVFDALFEDYDFAANNPVSQAMQKVVAVLEPKNIQKEAAELESFYASVRRRASGITSADGKQKIVVELYEKFFKNAFRKLSAKLGIVYTPVEVVDFIIHSVNDILQQEFGQTLGSKGVHILDPFTGTGTFVTRLLQSGLIDAADLEYKYKNEIHANEIVLLAYYIAAINIEATYHSISGKDYTPFTGICLTDTFEMYESDDMVAALMADNSERRTRQKALDIRVIIGNPPYSAGQKSEGDNAKNNTYPTLDTKIRDTYAAQSNAKLQRYLYDSYIRAIRWASDRIGDRGVIGFISGSGWIDKAYADGMRKCLEEECTSIYIVNLRGDVRKNMLSKGAAREGENIFGQGSMTGTAIAFFVKNPVKAAQGVYYYDIGDELKLGQKLAILQQHGSVASLQEANKFEVTTVDESYDWINKRDMNFMQHIVIGDKEKGAVEKLFSNFTLGVVTNRDAWCYNFSKSALRRNIDAFVGEYNSQASAAQAGGNVEEQIEHDLARISWTRSLKSTFSSRKILGDDAGVVVTSMYRPFSKQNLFYSNVLNEMLYQTRKLYPYQFACNRSIAISGVGARSGFSALMCDAMPNLHTIDTAQHFPLKLFEEVETDKNDLFAVADAAGGFRERDGITDYGLQHFRDAYKNANITKEDVFYYVYGLLHSDDYRETYADNLSKELPRIPAVKNQADFWAFSSAGRKLGDLHVNYESAEMYPVTVAEGNLQLAHIADPASYYRVEQMRYGGKRGSDKTVLHYNNNITLTNIPLAAYDYVVNGKAALDWVVERQRVKTDKDSGIVNDANHYANETMQNPAYPLELFQRVITVSLETMKIVHNLPKLVLAT